mgnify:CR=1 FL=1
MNGKKNISKFERQHLKISLYYYLVCLSMATEMFSLEMLMVFH